MTEIYLSSTRRASPLTEIGPLMKRPAVAFDTSGVPLETMLSAVDSQLKPSGDLQTTQWALAAEAMILYPAIASRAICRQTTQNSEILKWFEPALEELVRLCSRESGR